MKLSYIRELCSKSSNFPLCNEYIFRDYQVLYIERFTEKNSKSKGVKSFLMRYKERSQGSFNPNSENKDIEKRFKKIKEIILNNQNK